AARVIGGPLLGAVLLAVVATGLILHSLRYRSETVTGIAYFVGFVTLTISPASTFALVASVPLAGSLVFVAQRFSWHGLAVGGVILTYGAYVLRHGVSPPSFDAFTKGQAILAVYWLLFEGLDLVEAARRRRGWGLARMILPLNACGFVGVSLLQWNSVASDTLYVLLAGSAVAYIASTLARARLRPPSSFGVEASLIDRVLSGGYEGAVTVAVLLLTPAIFLRFSGLPLAVALLLEGEFLFLAGLPLAESYLRTLAAPVFVLPVLRLVLYDLRQTGDVSVLGTRLMASTPIGLLAAGVFYLNRGLL